MEKRDVVKVCPGRYPYVGGDADTKGDSRCLGGWVAADDPVFLAATMAMIRTDSSSSCPASPTPCLLAPM